MPLVDVSQPSEGFWQAYTPVYTGFSVDPTSITCRFCVVGKTCIYALRADTAGTSNATTFTITLPVPAVGVFFWYPANILNNGAASATPGMLEFASATVLNVYRDWTGLAWTASGGKNARFSITYEVA